MCVASWGRQTERGTTVQAKPGQTSDERIRSDRISVVLTPPEPWWPERHAFHPGKAPDPLEIYRAMAAEGVDVELLDPARKPLNPLYGQHPLYMGLDPARALKVLTRRRHFDMVLSVFESSCLVNLLLRRFVLFRPVVAMWDIVPTTVWRARSIMQDIVVPRIDHLFLLSSGQRAYLEKRWRAAGKTTVVYQHIDTGFFRPAAPSADGPVLAIGDDIGRDYDTLMQAVHDLDVDLVAKTRRPLGDPTGRRARVRQISDRLSFQSLRELYAAARFVVVPLHNTLNVSGVGSVLEALAMGKAMIVSDNPPIRDYVRPGETALVVPPSDPRALREAILTLHTDAQKREFLGRNARRFAEEMFAQDVFGRRMAREIRKVVETLTRPADPQRRALAAEKPRPTWAPSPPRLPPPSPTPPHAPSSCGSSGRGCCGRSPRSGR
jgi:glycosyltransferase involved in cell wall biosynthesis